MKNDLPPVSDSLYVNWHLLDGLNHDTPYSHEPDSVIHERFFREPLLETAYRLLTLNRPQYIFHFYGGEPTIHPYFADLVNYLSTSGRNVRMILETNGIRQLKYYKGLLHSISPERMCVRFAVHLKYMELEKVLNFVGFVRDHNQLCQVIINFVPEYAEKAVLFYQKLMQLQKVLSFGLSVAFPMGGEASWPLSLQGKGEHEPHLPAWTRLPEEKSLEGEPEDEAPFAGEELTFLDPEQNADFVLEFEEGTLCVGVDGVQVSADGTCTLGLVDSDQPFAPCILGSAKVRSDLPKPRSFASHEEAKEWLADFSARTLAYEIEGGPVRYPLGNENSLEQKVRSKLKRLASGSKYQRKLIPHPELWLEHKDEVVRIYEVISDEDSREVFLRRLKAQLFGLSSYLEPSNYEHFAHPELLALKEACKGSEKALLHLENTKIEDVRENAGKIAWYKPALEIVLPMQSEWLQILTLLTESCTDYSFYLGQHGLQTVFYGKSTANAKRFLPVPPRTIDGNPLISVILKASDDEEALTRTVESVQSENLPRYEIVVVQDEGTFAENVDALVRENPRHMRGYKFDEELTLSHAYDLGLDMAQGEYVCFVRAGDVLTKGMLTKSVKALEEEKSDLAISVQDLANDYTMDGRSAQLRYLTGELYEKGTINKVYRSSLIHDQAIGFADLPGNIEDDLINLQVLHAAGKVSCLSGKLIVREEMYEEGESSEEERFTTFTTKLGRLFSFCEAEGVSIKNPEMKAHLLRLYKEVEEDFEQLVHEADESGSVDEVLSKEVLSVMGKIPGFAEYLLSRILNRYAKEPDKRKVTCIEEKDLNVEYTAYEGASKNYEHTPKLSFVVRVDEGESRDLLESLIEEDPAEVECLILNNIMDKETREELEEYADLYPKVRIFHMQGHAYQAQCVRLGAEEARGEGVTFVSGSDEVDAEFIESTVKALSQKENADLLIFGQQSFEGEGRDLSDLSEGIVGREDLKRTFFEREETFSARGIVFNKEFIQKIIDKYDPLFLDETGELTLLAIKNVDGAYISQNGMISSSEDIKNNVIVKKCNIFDKCNDFCRDLESEETEDETINEKISNYIRNVIEEKYIPVLYSEISDKVCSDERDHNDDVSYELLKILCVVNCKKENEDV